MQRFVHLQISLYSFFFPMYFSEFSNIPPSFLFLFFKLKSQCIVLSTAI